MDKEKNEIAGQPQPDSELMTSKQVQELFHIGGQGLYLWRKKGLIPFHRIAGRCYYFRDEVMTALKRKVISR